MRDVIGDVDAWVARGDRVALATVIDVKRSAPRPPGAKMAVNDRGEVSGAVSGGCVEGAVVEVAEEVLRGGEPRLLHFGIADEQAWDVGLPCGGEIDVFIERVDDLPDPTEPNVVYTVVEGPRAGTRWTERDGAERTQLLERDGERVFAEVL